MTIKTFRGKIADGAQDIISLHTNNGSIGYRILKFQTIGVQPDIGGTAGEHYTKIWSVSQTTISATTPNIDFSDQTLLAVNWSSNNVERNFADSIIFDNMIINQDIYVTHTEALGSTENNYYIELEQFKLDLNENTVATLKDIRNLS